MLRKISRFFLCLGCGAFLVFFAGCERHVWSGGTDELYKPHHGADHADGHSDKVHDEKHDKGNASHDKDAGQSNTIKPLDTDPAPAARKIFPR